MPKPDKANNGKSWHADQETIDRKDGMSDGDDTVVIGTSPYVPPDYSFESNYTIKTYGGDDYIDMSDPNFIGVKNVVKAGEGNDFVKDSQFNDTIDLGGGNDIAEMTSGMGHVDGGKGSDIIKVYMEQFMNPPTPPVDPGGPFWLSIGGGSEKRGAVAIDTIQLYMSDEQLSNGYDGTISAAFEQWKGGDQTYTLPQGALDLGAATNAAGLEPSTIAIATDVENLQIYDGDGTLLYDYMNNINLIT